MPFKILCILLFISWSFASPYITYVKECPPDEKRWNARDKEFGCDKNRNLFYHCIASTNKEIVELCIRNVSIESAHVGCPQVYIDPRDKHKADFTLEHSICPTEIEGCPKEGHVPYFTNQLFRYPNCLKPERERNASWDNTTPLPSSSYSAFPDVHTTWKNEMSNLANENNELIKTILFAVLGLVIFLAIAASIALCIWLHQNRNKRNSRFGSTSPRPIYTPLDPTNVKDTQENTEVSESSKKSSKFPQDEYIRQAFLLLDIAKEVLWKQVSFVKNKDRNWREILNGEELKHTLYHHWEIEKCCYCIGTDEKEKRMWDLSENGWLSMYRKTDKRCEKGLQTCSCQYDARMICLKDISIATLFTFTFVYGEFSKEGKRHLQHLRRFCKEFIKGKSTGEEKTFTSHLENVMTNVAFHSRFRLVREMQIKIRDLPNRNIMSDNIREQFRIDFEDISPFEDVKLNSRTWPTIEYTTQEFLEDDFYVDIERIITEAERQIQSERFLIVSGKPGDGRKSFCKRLMRCSKFQRKLKLDYWQVNLDYFRRIQNQCLVYFEDMLGASLYTSLDTYEREDFLTNLKGFQDLQSSNVRIICSIESSKLQEALVKLNESERNRNRLEVSVLDLSSPKWKLDENERLKVLNEFGKQYPSRELGDDMKEKILKASRDTMYFGFLEKCVLYFQLQNNESLFFKHDKQLEEEIDCLSKYFPEEFTILTYILFANEPFDKKNYDEKLYKAIHEDVLSKCDQEHDKVETTKGILLQYDTDTHTHEFQHQFVKSAILMYYCRKRSIILLRHAVNAVIRNYVRPSSYTARSPVEVFGTVPGTSDQELAKRILECVDVSKVPTLLSSWDRKFVNKFLLSEIEQHLSKQENSLDDIVGCLVDEAISEENETFLECLNTRYKECSKDNKVAHSFHCSLQKKEKKRRGLADAKDRKERAETLYRKEETV